jgi:chondroitin 4-sulfotransferase 11
MKTLDRFLALQFPAQRAWARFKTRHMVDCAFVHINKTGGSSIEQALGLPFQHLTALELHTLLGNARWDRRFSFGFVRNPWDKVVSHYHYRVKTGQTGLGANPISFDEWVIRSYGEKDPLYYDAPRMFMPQVDWLADDSGAVMVDFVGRFERLHEDFAEVCRRMGSDASLPHLKKSRHREYRELYTKQSREVIERVFASDLERFGYGFE